MRICCLFGVLAVATLCSCGGDQGSQAKKAPAAATNQQSFHVKGVVKSIRPARKEVEIQHEAVPGYMPAMTMPFDVKDTNELSGLHPGDAVSFRLLVNENEAWIEQVRKTGEGASNASTRASVRLAKNVEPLNTGDLLPDYGFTNQFGQPFRTRDFKGHALALTFLFTRCPYPTFCPRMASRFSEAQAKLKQRPQLGANWRLLTISFDPDFDKPEVLKRYAESYGYDPAHWTFATGDLVEITAIAEQFGLAFWHDENGGLSHNLRTAVVDVSGRVRRIFEGNEWTSDELVRELEKAMKPPAN